MRRCKPKNVSQNLNKPWMNFRSAYIINRNYKAISAQPHKNKYPPPRLIHFHHNTRHFTCRTQVAGQQPQSESGIKAQTTIQQGILFPRRDLFFLVHTMFDVTHNSNKPSTVAGLPPPGELGYMYTQKIYM